MLKAGHAVALLTICLLVIGVLMVNSTELRVGLETTQVTHQSVFFGPPAIHATLAIGALTIACFLPISRLAGLSGWMAPAPWLLGLGILLLLSAWLPGVGRAMNNSHRWVEFAGIQFQASETIKWALPVFVAWLATRRSIDVTRFMKGSFPILVLIALICGTIAVEDLGTAVLVASVSTLVLVAAGARILHLILLLPFALGGLVAAIVVEPYRVQRVFTYLDPYQDPEGSGWHIIQSFKAISGGGLLGRGLGAGEQKFDLVSDTTDFIFSIICEELGLLGAALIASAFLVLLFCGLSIMNDRRLDSCPPDSGGGDLGSFLRLMGFAVLLTLGLQAVFNMLVTTGLIPTKGIALPLISRGGTGWILTAFFLGLLPAIERSAEALQHDTREDPSGPESASTLEAGVS
ncbi:MAG: stage V sporulation protein E [Phycisphaerae bacterium]|nr:stage V sporulation protein E [Phycisphaerae bacterium]